MRAKNNIEIRQIAGENLLIPVGEHAGMVNGLMVLSESGALLWEMLQQETDRQALVQCLLEEYEVEPHQAEEDVEKFLCQLEQANLLE